MSMSNTLEREKAFDIYYRLGSDRSLDAVSKEIKRSLPTIKNWSKQDNWVERCQQRDIENSRRLQQRTDEAVIDVKANYRKIIKAAIGKVLTKTTDGRVVLSSDFEVKSPRDLETLIKLDLLLMGEDTEKTGVSVSVSEWRDLLRSRITPKPTGSGEGQPPQ